MRILILICGLAVLSGCNTVEGLGEDISNGARAVDNVL